MFKNLAFAAEKIWAWFRRRSRFVQLLLAFPVVCAIAFTALVGNMGLALMGTAVALPAIVVGGVGGFFAVILGKAGIIIAKDRRRP